MSYPPQHPYGRGGQPPPQFQPGPPPYGQGGPPGMFPQPPQPKSRGTLLYAVIAVVAVAAIATVTLGLTGAFSSDGDEPVAIATDEPEASEEPESEPAPTETAETPVEEPPSEGGSYTAVDDICAIMEPIVSGYMTIDPDETDTTVLGDSTTCTMAGEFTDTFDRPFVSVEQDVDPALPSGGVEEYGFNEFVRSGCTLEEDVLPEFEESSYYHGDAGSGCVILGQKYALDAADGNMFIAVLISFGTEGGSLGGEEQLATDLAEAVIAAS